MKLLTTLALVVAALAPTVSRATIYTFDLQGTAGAGLLGGNENPAVITSSSGGEIGAGIFFDDSTNTITVNVGWGSGNGFTDLTGSVSGVHIHNSGSSSPDTGTAAFLRNGSVVVNFPNLPASYSVNISGSSGFVTGSSVLSGANVASLFAGQLYFNVHTSANPGGEIRGNLVNATAIPEPSTYAALAGLSILAVAGLRRRRS